MTPTIYESEKAVETEPKSSPEYSRPQLRTIPAAELLYHVSELPAIFDVQAAMVNPSWVPKIKEKGARGATWRMLRSLRGETEADVDAALRGWREELGLPDWRSVIVYGRGATSREGAEEDDEAEVTMRAKKLMSLVELEHPHRFREWLVVEGGIAAIRQEYPFLVVPVPTPTAGRGATPGTMKAAEVEQDEMAGLPPFYPSYVVPNLFIGSAIEGGDPRVHRDLSIRLVVNLSSVEVPYESDPQSPEMCRIPIADDNSQDLGIALSVALPKLLEAQDQKRSAIVYCDAGRSRSAAVVLAFLLASTEMSLEGSLTLLRKRRPQVCPNAGFMRQLVALRSAQKSCST